jgi:hypothetical protein
MGATEAVGCWAVLADASTKAADPTRKRAIEVLLAIVRRLC